MKLIFPALLSLALFTCHTGHAQKISVGAGIAASDNFYTFKRNGNAWNERRLGIGPGVVVSVAGETSRWRERISGSFVITNYTNPVNSEFYYNEPYQRLYNITGIGVNANFHLLKKRTELYLGIGPRLDIVDFGVNDQYEKTALFGGTASLSCNFPIGRSCLLGFRLNYYLQKGNIYESHYFDPGAPNNGLITADIDDYTIRNKQTADLQLVFSYRFAKKSK